MPINQPVKPNRVSKDLVNETIPFQQVLVIDQNGESLGVLPRKQALALAEKAGLDLYCVSPNACPAVCKIVNFGKLKFDRQKKEREAHKNQSSVVIKEMRFTPMTSTHDLETKANQCIKFLEKNMKIKVSVFMKGRMVTKVEAGEAILNKFIDLLKDYGFVEKKPMLEGKYYFCFISPLPKK